MVKPVRRLIRKFRRPAIRLNPPQPFKHHRRQSWFIRNYDDTPSLNQIAHQQRDGHGLSTAGRTPEQKPAFKDLAELPKLVLAIPELMKRLKHLLNRNTYYLHFICVITFHFLLKEYFYCLLDKLKSNHIL